MQDHQLIHQSKTSEWYTPISYVESAQEAMGSIDTDPATNLWANENIVHARVIYTIETDGLAHPWPGRVWLNPPYGKTNNKSNQGIWSKRLIEQYQQGIVTQAVLLVNAQTCERWFYPLFQYPICFTDHRIAFINAETLVEMSQPTHGNAFVYLGPRVENFVRAFRKWGNIVKGITL